MHRMGPPTERTSLRKLDAARSRGAASRRIRYLRLTFSRNGIRFLTNAFLGLAELGSLCE
jgi:hypothetical protein